MESQNRMLYKVNFCLIRNLPKLAISLLLMGLITSFALAFGLTPVFLPMLTMPGKIGALNIIIGFGLALAVTVLNYILQHGFFVLTLFLYTGRQAVIGHLFTGFFDFKRSIKAALFFTFTYGAVLIIPIILLSLGFSADMFEKKIFTQDILILIFILFSLVVLALFYLRFGFVWFFLYENPDLKVSSALKKSATLSKRKIFELIKFLVRCGSWYLLVGFFSFIFVTLFSFIEKNNFLIISSFSFIRIVYTLCLYMSLIRICTGFAAWYIGSSSSEPDDDESEIKLLC